MHGLQTAVYDALEQLQVEKASCSTDEHHLFLPQLRLCCQLPVRHALQFAGQQWSPRVFKCQNPSHKHLHITLIQVRRCFSLLGSSTGAPWAPPWVTAAPLALPDVSTPGSMRSPEGLTDQESKELTAAIPRGSGCQGPSRQSTSTPPPYQSAGAASAFLAPPQPRPGHLLGALLQCWHCLVHLHLAPCAF